MSRLKLDHVILRDSQDERNLKLQFVVFQRSGDFEVPQDVAQNDFHGIGSVLVTDANSRAS